MQKKLPLWKSILIILGMAVFMGYMAWTAWGVYEGNKTNKLLEQEGKITTGEVLSIIGGYRSSMYATYEFYINGKRYEGEAFYYRSKNVNVGDKYEVLYYPQDPTIRRLLFDKPILTPSVSTSP